MAERGEKGKGEGEGWERRVTLGREGEGEGWERRVTLGREGDKMGVVEVGKVREGEGESEGDQEEGEKDLPINHQSL